MSTGCTGPVFRTVEHEEPFLRLDALPDCDCGGEAARAPHALWCSLKKRLDSDAAAAKMK